MKQYEYALRCVYDSPYGSKGEYIKMSNDYEKLEKALDDYCGFVCVARGVFARKNGEIVDLDLE